MRRVKIFITFFVITLIAFGIYSRDYIPATRSDAENLYYYFTDNNNVVVPSDSAGGAEESLSNSNLDSKKDPSPTAADAASGRDDNTNTNQNENTNSITTLPASVNNLVPFTPQAPFGVWDQLHEEACEEASLVMAHYFLEERSVVLSKEADKDIKGLIEYIKKEDVTVGELKKVAENYYKHNGWKIIGDPKVNDFKKELAADNIIIVPLAGREIGNPYYKQPGPLYHMLVVSGYDDKKGVFITQDPGTKRGKNYEYKFQTLIKAIHDWTGDKNKIKEGDSRILVVIK